MSKMKEHLASLTYLDGLRDGHKEVVRRVEALNILNDEPWSEDYKKAYGYDPLVEGDVVLLAISWQSILQELGLK